MESFKEGKARPTYFIWSCGIAKLMGTKLVYIEVYDRIDKPTVTGRLVYPITDRFIVQWEEQKKVYPRAINLGSIY